MRLTSRGRQHDDNVRYLVRNALMYRIDDLVLEMRSSHDARRNNELARQALGFIEAYEEFRPSEQDYLTGGNVERWLAAINGIAAASQVQSDAAVRITHDEWLWRATAHSPVEYAEHAYGPTCPECGIAFRQPSPDCPHRITNVHPLASRD